MRCFAFWLALFPTLPLRAQVQDESPAPVRTYNLLRENDDWSFLADPSLRSDFWDPIKYMPLGCDVCEACESRRRNPRSFRAGRKR